MTTMQLQNDLLSESKMICKIFVQNQHVEVRIKH